MFKRLFKRLSTDEAELRAEAIRAWVSSVPGVVRIADAEPRTVVRIAGVVENVKVRPRDGVPTFEAVISDGSGTVTAVWLGRRTVAGLTLGSRLIIQGRLGGTRGRMQVVNPQYDFEPPERAH